MTNATRLRRLDTICEPGHRRLLRLAGHHADARRAARWTSATRACCRVRTPASSPSAPRRRASGTGCAGRAFTVTVVDSSSGTVRFTPTAAARAARRVRSSHRLPFGVLSCPSTPRRVDRLQTLSARHGRRALRHDELASSRDAPARSTSSLRGPSLDRHLPRVAGQRQRPKISGTHRPAPPRSRSTPARTAPARRSRGSAADFARRESRPVANDSDDDLLRDGDRQRRRRLRVLRRRRSPTSRTRRRRPCPPSTDTDPVSPSYSNSPAIKGTAPAGSTVSLYTNADVHGPRRRDGHRGSVRRAGLQVAVANDSTTTFYATATDAAGNASACSGALTYVEDSTAPGAPSPSGTTPPRRPTTTRRRSTARPRPASTVRLYTTANCSGPAVGAGSAAAFASAGIEVTVADNSTTTFYAHARPTRPATSRPARTARATSRTRSRRAARS